MRRDDVGQRLEELFIFIRLVLALLATIETVSLSRCGPLMLVFDRRILDIPLEERLQSRTSDLVAWAKTMFPVIHQSIREARAQLFLSYFSEPTTNAAPNTPAASQPRILPQPVPTLVYSRFNSDFSMQEHN
jgi:hypothetical protein